MKDQIIQILKNRIKIINKYIGKNVKIDDSVNLLQIKQLKNILISSFHKPKTILELEDKDFEELNKICDKSLVSLLGVSTDFLKNNNFIINDKFIKNFKRICSNLVMELDSYIQKNKKEYENIVIINENLVKYKELLKKVEDDFLLFDSNDAEILTNILVNEKIEKKKISEILIEITYKKMDLYMDRSGKSLN